MRHKYCRQNNRTNYYYTSIDRIKEKYIKYKYIKYKNVLQ